MPWTASGDWYRFKIRQEKNDYYYSGSVLPTVSQTIEPSYLTRRCWKKLGGQEREKSAQTATTNGCQIFLYHSLEYPHREVRSVVSMTQTHILAWHLVFPQFRWSLNCCDTKKFHWGSHCKALERACSSLIRSTRKARLMHCYVICSFGSRVIE